MAEALIPLTKEQRAEWAAMMAKTDSIFLPAIAHPDAENQHKHVYVVAFDGTQNDREHVPPGEIATIPAKLETELSKHYDGKTLAGQYYPGVGTRENNFESAMNSATGNGSEQKAEQAFTDFRRQAEAWLKEDPEAQITVVVLGFSRGAATGRHLLNLLDERGIPADDGHRQASAPDEVFGQQHELEYGGYLRKPGSVPSVALLLDTVATGQESTLKLGIPGSTSAVVHLVSKDEGRVTFPLTTINAPVSETGYSRLFEFNLPGVHSDIGGSYSHGLDAGSLYVSTKILEQLGLPLEAGPVPIAALEEGRHNSDWALTPLARSVQSFFEGPGREVHSVQNQELTMPQLIEANHNQRDAILAEMNHSNAHLGEQGEAAKALGVQFYTAQFDSPDAEHQHIHFSTTHPEAVTFNESTKEIFLNGHLEGKLNSWDEFNLNQGISKVYLLPVIPEHAPAPDNHEAGKTQATAQPAPDTEQKTKQEHRQEAELGGL